MKRLHKKPTQAKKSKRLTKKPSTKQTPSQTKVFVGLSGGVDSSVSAALLKKAGYDVTGVFIKVWQPDFIDCTWREDRLDAMRVCAKLEIPFITLDLEEEYKRDVVDYMIAEYKAGRTPNPDVMCNKSVKFGAFLRKAREMGADYIATGHYAQVEQRKQNGVYEMLVSADAEKDQSYFLWTLGQDELRHTLFPVGHLKKPEVRKLAKKFGLITADKKDSQGLCFIGKIDFKEFLKNYIPEKRGDVLNEKSEIIGYHTGVHFLTIGERHGFTVTAKTTDEKPYYVVAKNIPENTITVSQKVSALAHPIGKEIAMTKISLVDIHWISGQPDLSDVFMARTRYRQELQRCQIQKTDSGYEVLFLSPQKTLSPGQSLVIYSKKRCLGGAIL